MPLARPCPLGLFSKVVQKRSTSTGSGTHPLSQVGTGNANIQAVPHTSSPVQHGAVTVMVGISQAGRAVTHETALDLPPLVKNDKSTTPLTMTSGRWGVDKPASLTSGPCPHENKTTSMSKKQPPFRTSALQVVKVPGDGSCFFHAMTLDTPYSVQELRHLVADTVILNTETRFNGMTVCEWIQTETDMTPAQYADDMRKNGWGGQVDMHLLAQFLQKSFHVYIKSESGIPTHQYTFEPISNSQQRMTLPKPIRLIFDRNHYDAIVKHIPVEDNITSKRHKPPAQVEQATMDLGPIARKMDEFLAPQAIVRADNDEWIIVGMRSKGYAQKQCTRITTKDQHGKTPPGQTTPFAPGSGGQVNGLKTDIPGALDPNSPNDQLGRDVMGRTIIRNGVQRIMSRSQLAQMESPYRPGLEGFTTQGAARDNRAMRMNPALAPPPSLQSPGVV
jgi:hypothetical protein